MGKEVEDDEACGTAHGMDKNPHRHNGGRGRLCGDGARREEKHKGRHGKHLEHHGGRAKLSEALLRIRRLAAGLAGSPDQRIARNAVQEAEVQLTGTERVLKVQSQKPLRAAKQQRPDHARTQRVPVPVKGASA